MFDLFRKDIKKVKAAGIKVKTYPIETQKRTRTRKDPELVRDKKINLRLSSAEFDYLLKQCEERGIKPTELLREKLNAPVARKEIHKKKNKELFLQLNRIGNNLNQLVKILHTEKYMQNNLSVIIKLFCVCRQLEKILMEIKNVD